MTCSSTFWLRVALVLTAAASWGCSRKIGDACQLSVDCGIQNNRVCIDTDPGVGGYCTQIGCTSNGCPDEAACFLFRPRVPGCAYDDREPARTARAFCMLSCEEDNDCRPGYVCADLTDEPWRTVLLDDEDPNPRACIRPASYELGGLQDEADEPPICAETVPGTDAVADAGTETDAEPDAAEPDATQ